MNIRFSIHGFAFRDACDLPKLDFVPALMRRKLSMLEKAVLAVLHETDAAEPCPVVFASRFGEWRQTFKLFRQFHEEKELSPAGFSLSVHNAAPGIYSLIKKNTETYTAISAGPRSAECGLLEALLMRSRALFVSAEEPMPEFYREEFEEPAAPCAIALAVGCGNDFEMTEGVTGAAPLNAAALKDFLEQKTPTLVCESFTLSRRSA